MTDVVGAESANGIENQNTELLLILYEFHPQFVRLKSSEELFKSKGCNRQSQKWLISKKRSPFEDVQILKQAAKGDYKSINQLNTYKIKSKDYVNQVSALAQNVKDYFSNTNRNSFNTNEWNLIKSGQPFTDSLNQKIKGCLEKFNKDACKIDKLVNGFMFRISVCVFLTILYRDAHGSLKSLKDENYQRDMIDAMVITYATYFNGVLTK